MLHGIEKFLDLAAYHKLRLFIQLQFPDIKPLISLAYLIIDCLKGPFFIALRPMTNRDLTLAKCDRTKHFSSVPD